MTQNRQQNRLDQIEAILLQTNTAALAQLTAKVDGLTEEVDSLRNIVMHSIENAERHCTKGSRLRPIAKYSKLKFGGFGNTCWAVGQQEG